MADKGWKVYEREVSRFFGYQRALMKGTEEKSDARPLDGSEPEWIIDAKKRKKLYLWQWMSDLVEYSQREEKPAILVFSVYGKRQSYAVVERKWFFGNFAVYIGNFRMMFWKKSDRKSFEQAFREATVNAGDDRIPGLLMNQYSEAGNIDYICIEIEHLISLMKAKKMLKTEREEDE